MLQKLKSIFSYRNDSYISHPVDRRSLLTLILIAFAFSISIRLLVAYEQYGNPNFYFEGAPIIKSPDGFYYAEGARDIINSANTPDDGRSPITSVVSILTAGVYHLLPGLKLEWAMYFIPVVFGSLVVVPIVLLGIEAGSAVIGFFAAMIAASSIGFVNRSFAGYYDDDFLTLTLPFFVAYGVIALLRDKNNLSLLVYLAVASLLYSLEYSNANSIISVIAALLLVYTLIYEKGAMRNYLFVATLLLVATQIPLWQKLPLLILLLVAIKKGIFENQKYLFIFLASSVSLFAFFGGFDPLINRFSYYIFKPMTKTDELNLHFFSSLKTVSESQYSNFNDLFESFSGNLYLFFAGLFGYLLLLRKNKRFLLLLPLLGLGLLSIDGGTRFTPYGSPILALGFVSLVATAVSYMPKEWLKYPLLITATILALYPSYKYLKEFRPPSVLLPAEIVPLVELSKKSKPNDYVYSWWDYGYQVRYYSHTKTHTDGAMQEGYLSYIESMALSMTSPRFAANWLREATEARELNLQGKINSTGSTLGDMMKYGANPVKNPWTLVEMMTSPEFKTSKKTRDIYWMMPMRMLQIFGTIQKFTDTDPVTGKMNSQRMYMFIQGFSEDEKEIKLSNGLKIAKQEGLIKDANGKPLMPIGSYIKVSKPNQTDTISQITNINDNSPINVMFVEQMGSFIIADTRTMNSNFIQMFVFDNYDRDVFEKVSDNGWIKIFKSKI